MTPLQARVNLRTMYTNGDITQEEMSRIDDMLTSSDRENHTVAVGIMEFKKKEKVKRQLHVITGSVEIDIMKVDISYLIEITNMSVSKDRDQLFAMYLNLVPMPDTEKARLIEMLDSTDQESTYLAEQIIINKIREIQKSDPTGNNFTDQLQKGILYTTNRNIQD